MYANVGTIRPVVHAQKAGEPTKSTVGRAILQDLDLAQTLAEFQQHVEGLTLGILDVQIEDLPMRLQCHTIGVPSRWMRLLRMIAQAVTCYHENH